MAKRPVLGLTTPVQIRSNNKEEKITARVDTGATSSSIDTSLALALNLGPALKSRVVKSASGVKERPIIKAEVNINGSIIEAEFTVADRKHMTYKMLIGQNILKQGNFLIDPHKGAEQ